MRDSFTALSRQDQKDALTIAAQKSGRPPHLLEKDVWVVWLLNVLFSSDAGTHLTFKGGTSLSKAYQVIDRFSEDIDLTYDVREIANDLVGTTPDGLPPSPSQAKKWSKTIAERLTILIDEVLQPHIESVIATSEFSGLVKRVERSDTDVLVHYEPLRTGTGYVLPVIKLEFGARASGEPASAMNLMCDAASVVTEVTFPTATPQVMSAERTFWEKATAVHVYCRSGRFRGGDRYARHWYDLVRLDEAGIAESAIANIELAQQVSQHKNAFFREKDRDDQWVDYVGALREGVNLVPEGTSRDSLKTDYQKMIDDQLFYGEYPSFAELLERCAKLEKNVGMLELI